MLRISLRRMAHRAVPVNWRGPELGRVAAYLIAAIAAVLILQQLGQPAVPDSRPETWDTPRPAAADFVERSGKGDRTGPMRPAARTADIVAIEVVGLKDAAIVYRDRDGRVLFRTDPLTNATVVVRGVSLPEVTIREHRGRSVAPVPVDVRPNGERTRVPVGCDPAISPLADPSPLTGYCITENNSASTFVLARLAP
jgi:hypothetical protein